MQLEAASLRVVTPQVADLPVEMARILETVANDGRAILMWTEISRRKPHHFLVVHSAGDRVGSLDDECFVVLLVREGLEACARLFQEYREAENFSFFKQGCDLFRGLVAFSMDTTRDGMNLRQQPLMFNCAV